MKKIIFIILTTIAALAETVLSCAATFFFLKFLYDLLIVNETFWLYVILNTIYCVMTEFLALCVTVFCTLLAEKLVDSDE